MFLLGLILSEGRPCWTVLVTGKSQLATSCVDFLSVSCVSSLSWVMDNVGNVMDPLPERCWIHHHRELCMEGLTP